MDDTAAGAANFHAVPGLRKGGVRASCWEFLLMCRSSDTFHKTGLTALENPWFSNEKTDWMDAEREQAGAMGGLWLFIGFVTPPPQTQRRLKPVKGWGLMHRVFPRSGRRFSNRGSGRAQGGLFRHKKPPPGLEAGRRWEWWLGNRAQALAAWPAFASSACLARATMAEKAAASWIARSERILRSASIPAALRPSMKRE